MLVTVLLLALPSAAFACPACLDLTSENRIAFLQTAAALSLLPFGLVGGLGFWLRRRMREGSEAEELYGSEEPRPDERRDRHRGGGRHQL